VDVIHSQSSHISYRHVPQTKSKQSQNIFFFTIFLCNKQNLLYHIHKWHSDISLCGPPAQICLCIMFFKQYLQAASHLSLHVFMQIFSKLWHKLFKIKSLSLYILSHALTSAANNLRKYDLHNCQIFITYSECCFHSHSACKWNGADRLCVISYDKTLYI